MLKLKLFVNFMDYYNSSSSFQNRILQGSTSDMDHCVAEYTLSSFSLAHLQTMKLERYEIVREEAQ